MAGSKRIEMLGNIYGKLTVLKYAYSVDYGWGTIKTFWTCKCNCGTVFETNGDNLRRGLVNSCGCIRNNSRQMREGREEYFQKGIRLRFIPGEDGRRIYLDQINIERQQRGELK